MDPSAKIALAYATSPTDRVCELFHMPQLRASLLGAFVHFPDSLEILIPLERPLASPDSSLLSRLLEEYFPFIPGYSIDIIFNPFGETLSSLHVRYLESVYGDRNYGEPAFDVTELPEEFQDEIDGWVAKGGYLCGFYLKPPVELLVDWLRGQDTQDDAHPHYCNGCHKYTTNLETDYHGPVACYLCMACEECGTCHCLCCSNCSNNCRSPRRGANSIRRIGVSENDVFFAFHCCRSPRRGANLAGKQKR